MAPIRSLEKAENDVYDFWAVGRGLWLETQKRGIDCCTPDYQCGEYANPKAHAGLRLLSALAPTTH